MKVQASEVGLEVQKYPQKAQNTAKKDLSTYLKLYLSKLRRPRQKWFCKVEC